MSSELELLKQRIIEIEVENAELRKNTVIPILETSSQYKEIRAEKSSVVVDGQPQNDPKGNNSSNNSTSNFNSVTMQRSESKHDEEMDISLPKEPVPEVSPASSKTSKEMEIDAFSDGCIRKRLVMRLSGYKARTELTKELLSGIISAPSVSFETTGQIPLVSHLSSSLDTMQNLVRLFQNAIRAGHEVILSWLYYSNSFENKVDEIRHDTGASEKQLDHKYTKKC
ncbi:hypothetical protein GLOIN_2v1779307 [Rhizophagus clarus]|uniref:Uncharacterized protein n=1 Tax=Rhizophagus clarus TaxID=94130 RepID=A0A8H3M3C3_9GLOM|nr:hypothetical protein GLOIN_2v1779307 [Rhizophagus clarus]